MHSFIVATKSSAIAYAGTAGYGCETDFRGSSGSVGCAVCGQCNDL